jgi:hypothetical protein
MDKTTVLQIIKIIDNKLNFQDLMEVISFKQALKGKTGITYEKLDAGGRKALKSLRDNLQKYIQDKPGCDYCKSIGRDCYCCAADE